MRSRMSKDEIQTAWENKEKERERERCDIPLIINLLRRQFKSFSTGFQKSVLDARPGVSLVRELVVDLGEILERQAQCQAHDRAGGVEEEFGEEGRIDCCTAINQVTSLYRVLAWKAERK